MRRIGMPLPEGEHGEKRDHVSRDDKPSVPDPLRDGFCLRVLVAEGNSGRGAKPYHGTAKPDRVGEKSPIVAALIEGPAR